MRKNLALIALIALGAAAISAESSPAATLAQWTFESDTGNYTYPATPALNSPVPETGTGTAISLGMSNNFTFTGGEGPGSVPWSDTVSLNGSIVWRVRGPSNVSGGGATISNGWNTAAARYTTAGSEGTADVFDGVQGARFAVSTSGYQNVNVAFDWFTTTQGAADMQPRYSLNGGATWQNVPQSDFVGWAPYTNNQAGPWSPITFANNGAGTSTILMQNTADVNVNAESFKMNFSSIPGANNNPNFMVDLVSDYDPTLQGYASATSVAGGTPAPLNNNSGNWRMDNVTFSGTAVPEPGTLALLAAGAFAVAGCYVRRKRNS